jgi:hypothetical protein
MNYLHSYHTVTDTGKNQRAITIQQSAKERYNTNPTASPRIICLAESPGTDDLIRTGMGGRMDWNTHKIRSYGDVEVY